MEGATDYTKWTKVKYVFVLAHVSHTSLPPFRKIRSWRELQRVQKCWLQEPVTTQLFAFSRPVTKEKTAEQLAQTCILWLITSGSHWDQGFYLNI